MRHPVMEHNDAAEKNARELIHLMECMVNDLKTDRMYDSYREIASVELEALVLKINEYNAHVKAIKELCAE